MTDFFQNTTFDKTELESTVKAQLADKGWTPSFSGWYSTYAYFAGSGMAFRDGKAIIGANYGGSTTVNVDLKKEFSESIKTGKVLVEFDIAKNQNNTAEYGKEAYISVNPSFNGTDSYPLIKFVGTDVYCLDADASGSPVHTKMDGVTVSNTLTGDKVTNVVASAYTNVKIVIDFSTKKINTTIGDKSLETTLRPYWGQQGLNGIYLKGYKPSGNTDSAGENMALFDNIKASHTPANAEKIAGIDSVRFGEDELNGFAEIPADTNTIKVNFISAMNQIADGKITVKDNEGNVVAATGELSADGLVYTLTLTDSLAGGTEYVLNIPGYLTNTQGYVMARDYNGGFMTEKAAAVFEISTLKAVKEDGTDAVSLATGDKVKATVTFVNSEKKAFDVWLVCGIYTGDKLVDVKALEIDMDASETENVTTKETELLTVPKDATAVKAFLWNKTNLQPVK